MQNTKIKRFGALVSAFILAFMLIPSIAFADDGTVHVTIYHHYEDVATPVQENKQLEAGDYALDELIALTTDDASYVHITDGTRYVTLEEGYSYTINIYYARVYTVTFMLNYGANDVHETKTLTGMLMRLGTEMPVDPSRSGYDFLGWNTEADGSGEAFTPETVVEDDITVYAQWREVDAEETIEPQSVLPDTGDTGLFVLPFLLIGISLICFGAALRFTKA